LIITGHTFLIFSLVPIKRSRYTFPSHFNSTHSILSFTMANSTFDLSNLNGRNEMGDRRSHQLTIQDLRLLTNRSNPTVGKI
jgi:hypothetical protein